MSDLIGKRFGRLTVIGQDVDRRGYVVCECECGNLSTVRVTSLTRKKVPTRSCGCLHRDVSREVGSRTIQANSAKNVRDNIRYNTNFSMITSDKPPKNNTSGYKGVYFDSLKGKYVAYIGIHGKRIHLGYFSKLDDAVKVRRDAEDRLFAPLIEARNAESQ